jgi:uncharacterized protein YbjQ (UPF0145 family)
MAICRYCNKPLGKEEFWEGAHKDCMLKNQNLNDEEQVESVKRLESIEGIKTTTAFSFAENEIQTELKVISAECVFGMNIFRDFFAGLTDFFGGRSEASQKILRDARETCLYELKREAYEIGADGIIGIDLDYQEISGKGKGMLFLVASGTAVKFK